MAKGKGEWSDFEQAPTSVEGRGRGEWSDFVVAPVSRPHVNVPEMNVDPSEGMDPLEKLVVGYGAATDRAARGLAGLVPESWQPQGLKDYLSEGAESAEAYQKHHPGGWATTGEIAADVVNSALPVARGGRALAKAAAMARAGRAAPVVGDVLANAGYAAATAPEDRGTAALLGGGGAGVAHGLTRGVGRPVTATPEAQALMDRGVRLTPGQAGGAGGWADEFEKTFEKVPVVGDILKRQREQGLADWNRSVRGGAESVEDLGETLGARYKEALPEGVPLRLDAQAAQVYDDTVLRLGKTVAPSARGKFHEVAEWVGENLRQGVDASQFKESITNELRAATKKAFKDGDHSLAVALQSLDRDVVGALPHFPNMPPAAEGLPAIDKAYREFKVLKKTGEKLAAQKRGAFYPSELLGPATKGRERLQTEALSAQKVFGDAPSGGPASAIMDLARQTAGKGAALHALTGGVSVIPLIASTLGLTPLGRRVILGQTSFQEFARAHPAHAALIARAIAEQKAQR